MDSRHGQFKTLSKKLEATEVWFLCRECYESHGLQKNQTKVYQEADTTISLKNRVGKGQATFFLWPCVRREKLQHLETSGRKRQQKKTA